MLPFCLGVDEGSFQSHLPLRLILRWTINEIYIILLVDLEFSLHTRGGQDLVSTYLSRVVSGSSDLRTLLLLLHLGDRKDRSREISEEHKLCVTKQPT